MRHIFVIASQVASHKTVATTSAVGVTGLGLSEAASKLSSWLQVLILAGTAGTVLFKLVVEIWKFYRNRQKTKRHKR